MALNYQRFLDAFDPGEQLYGGGQLLAPVFAEMVMRGRPRHPDYPPFRACLEWCCGQGHIGLWLLVSRAAETIEFVDANQAALDSVEETIAKIEHNKGWRYDIADRYGMAASLKDVGERFDLVVANPPSYCNLLSDAEIAKLAEDDPRRQFMGIRQDPRPSDPGWRIHDRFYQQIPAFLVPGAQLFVAEVMPWSERVVLPGLGEWDRRPEPPVETFRRMIEEAGLRWMGCERFELMGWLEMGMMRAEAG